MSSRFMRSVSELCFADRDLLPSYMRGPERERRPYGADAAETQRYFGAEDDLEYLVSADSRQDEDASSTLGEVLCGAWAELDADEELDFLDSEGDFEPFEAAWSVERDLVREPIDPEEAAIRRASRREASEAISRSFGNDDRARGGNSKPRRIHDSRETLRRG